MGLLIRGSHYSETDTHKKQACRGVFGPCYPITSGGIESRCHSSLSKPYVAWNSQSPSGQEPGIDQKLLGGGNSNVSPKPLASKGPLHGMTSGETTKLVILPTWEKGFPWDQPPQVFHGLRS